MTSTPAASGEPGTRFWAELINPDWAEVPPAPVGNAEREFSLKGHADFRAGGVL